MSKPKKETTFADANYIGYDKRHSETLLQADPFPGSLIGVMANTHSETGLSVIENSAEFQTSREAQDATHTILDDIALMESVEGGLSGLHTETNQYSIEEAIDYTRYLKDEIVPALYNEQGEMILEIEKSLDVINPLMSRMEQTPQLLQIRREIDERIRAANRKFTRFANNLRDKVDATIDAFNPKKALYKGVVIPLLIITTAQGAGVGEARAQEDDELFDRTNRSGNAIITNRADLVDEAVVAGTNIDRIFESMVNNRQTTFMNSAAQLHDMGSILAPDDDEEFLAINNEDFTPTPDAPSQQENLLVAGDQATVNSRQRYRREPSSESGGIAFLNPNEVVEVLGISADGNWALVNPTSFGQDGWIEVIHLTEVGGSQNATPSIEAVPVAPTQVAPGSAETPEAGVTATPEATLDTSGANFIDGEGNPVETPTATTTAVPPATLEEIANRFDRSEIVLASFSSDGTSADLINAQTEERILSIVEDDQGRKIATANVLNEQGKLVTVEKFVFMLGDMMLLVDLDANGLPDLQSPFVVVGPETTAAQLTEIMALAARGGELAGVAPVEVAQNGGIAEEAVEFGPSSRIVELRTINNGDPTSTITTFSEPNIQSPKKAGIYGNSRFNAVTWAETESGLWVGAWDATSNSLIWVTASNLVIDGNQELAIEGLPKHGETASAAPVEFDLATAQISYREEGGNYILNINGQDVQTSRLVLSRDGQNQTEVPLGIEITNSIYEGKQYYRIDGFVINSTIVDFSGTDMEGQNITFKALEVVILVPTGNGQFILVKGLAADSAIPVATETITTQPINTDLFTNSLETGQQVEFFASDTDWPRDILINNIFHGQINEDSRKYSALMAVSGTGVSQIVQNIHSNQTIMEPINVVVSEFAANFD